MRFQPNGVSHDIDPAEAQSRILGSIPDPLRTHWVEIEGRRWPVKQAFETATRIARAEYTSHQALHVFKRPGFRTSEIASSPSHDRGPRPTTPSPTPAAVDPGRGTRHTEANVQALVVAHLVQEGWRILSVADTASKEHGIDIVAERRGTTLGIEVKGYPTTTYADPRRVGEIKPTQPTTQAVHWYAQAMLAAMRLRHRQPDYRSVIALPDFPRYQRLIEETESSLALAGIEVWLVEQSGAVELQHQQA